MAKRNFEVSEEVDNDFMLDISKKELDYRDKNYLDIGVFSSRRY